MDLTKYKWKCRILLLCTTCYRDNNYKKSKELYQTHMKEFHKRHVKLICKIKKKKKSSINLIGFDGKSKKMMDKLNYEIMFKLIDKMPLSKKFKPINLSLYSDYNPKTTTQGLGFKNKEKALYTIKTIKNRPIKYQVNVIATMLGRAKNHPNKTVDMEDAIKIFSSWMKKYKSKKNEN